MVGALQKGFRVPHYLLVVMQVYLRDRELSYENKDGKKSRMVPAGAAQESILRPVLWNVSYGGLLRFDMPHGVFLVGYAVDVAAIIYARAPHLARLYLKQVMIWVFKWMAW